MNRRIVFSDDAIEILLSITNYIENNWGTKQADKFLDKVYKTLFLASGNPYMFKAFRLSDNIRVGLISKQTSFFYRVQENEIIILLFWDNRQEPLFNP
jgi:plasmid stabilization system protein ParE